MSVGGVENHWHLRGEDGYLIIRFFFGPRILVTVRY